MSSETSIEWTRRPGTRGMTWNPLGGCSDAGDDCAHCYARGMSERIPNMARARGNAELERKYTGLTKRSAKRHLLQWTGVVRTFPDRLAEPLKQKAPATYFVNSMSDLFHAEVPFEFIAAVYGVMGACPQHTFIILTKRADRRREWFEWCGSQQGSESTLPPRVTCYLSACRPQHLGGDQLAPPGWPDPGAWPLPNVWEGVSVGNRAGLWRLDELRKTPAAIRLVSFEPLLEDLGEVDLTGIDWAIPGGESGSKARECHVAWIRSLVRQCAAAGTACFVKQLGATIRVPDDEPLGDVASGWSAYARTCVSDDNLVRLTNRKGGDPSEWSHDLRVRQFPEVRP